MPTDKIIDFVYFGTVNDLQDTDEWMFDQSEDSNMITKEQLDCEDSLKEDFDSFFMNENEEILAMSGIVPTLDKPLYKPVYEED